MYIDVWQLSELVSLLLRKGGMLVFPAGWQDYN